LLSGNKDQIKILDIYDNFKELKSINPNTNIIPLPQAKSKNISNFGGGAISQVKSYNNNLGDMIGFIFLADVDKRIVCGGTKYINIYDTELKLLTQISTDNLTSIGNYSKNSIITGYSDGLIKIFNMTTFNQENSLKTDIYPINCILYLSNQNTVISGSNNLNVYDLKNKKLLKTLLTHPVKSLTLLFNNKFASCSKSFIRIWRIDDDYKCIMKIETDSPDYRIRQLDEDNIVKISDKGVLEIWSLKQSRCVKTITDEILNSNFIVLRNDLLVEGPESSTLWSYINSEKKDSIKI
jgi:hypothetical protein